MVWLELVIFIGILWGLVFFNSPIKVWAPVLTIALLLLTFLPGLSWPVLSIVWIIFLGITAIFSLRFLRQRLLTTPLLNYFQKVLPPISATERQVIEAGDVWWEVQLFRGKPNWNEMLAMPTPALSTVEAAFLAEQVETLCAMLNDWEMMHTDKALTADVWAYIKSQGFLGLGIPKEYGGHGFSTFAHSQIITKIASRSVSAAVTVMVPNALGPAEFLYHFGTPEQKNYYLPRLAAGVEIPAFALTSPEAGSDAGNIPDSGIVCWGQYAGAEVLGMRLNWNKRYITLAPIATLLGLAIKLYDPQQLLGTEENIGITLCLVPTHLPGINNSRRHFPAGLAFLNGPSRGQDVFVPLSFIIGGTESRGKGWGMMMEALAGGRGVSLPALGAAAAQLCYRTTGAYGRLREQFQLPIGQFEGVGDALGHIGGLTYLCEATRYFTLCAIAQQFKPALPAAITKYHVTEMSRRIVNHAMDIHAGRTVQWGPRNYLAFLYQSLPISITVEGANILTRNLIIFGQGALRCHPYIRDEIAAASLPNPTQRLKQFDSLLIKHLGYASNNFARVLAYGLSGGLLIHVGRTNLKYYYRQLTRMSAALAFSADVVTAVVGGQLKRKENISARLGDVLSHLYMATAVLKYYEVHKCPQEDLPFVQWSLENCLYEIQRAFDELSANFKPRWLGCGLYRIIFPWGRAYKKPRDLLGQQMATAMMYNSPQRDRLTKECYIGKEKTDAVARMERALSALENSAPARAKLQAAVAAGQVNRKSTFDKQIKEAEATNSLSVEELTILKDFAALLWDAIQVDEFDFSLQSFMEN